eukprot:gnl/Hemi2/16550_TR5541_c0_g1_i1.p1 gnl/Hemi2/16550_TR5541_c0_g1~~gnl/Hemi2/16550_TR5541_c0_g1_i1.p1  ORF type:complete len:117 (+),score=44.22 gnl/Hemi2/16550_TR5541_c0_g1_i1:42-353(+)
MSTEGFATSGWSLSEAAAIPSPTRVSAANAPGSCQLNVDNQCISGGTLSGGASGYNIPSLGAPGATCSAVPIFCTTQTPYTNSSQGYQCAASANTVRALNYAW